MNRQVVAKDEVQAIAKAEFQQILDRFQIQQLSLDKASADRRSEVNAPGVYVYWNAQYGVIKVGKSESNSKSRALQHIRDHTRENELDMASLSGDPNTCLILFNLKLERDIHWLCSLERFLENNLDPYIHSGR
jgi:hypothetical protein